MTDARQLTLRERAWRERKSLPVTRRTQCALGVGDDRPDPAVRVRTARTRTQIQTRGVYREVPEGDITRVRAVIKMAPDA